MGWHDTVTEQGLVYDAPGRGQGGVARPYWDESVHYVFSMDEILALAGAQKVPVERVDAQALDRAARGGAHRPLVLPRHRRERGAHPVRPVRIGAQAAEPQRHPVRRRAGRLDRIGHAAGA